MNMKSNTENKSIAKVIKKNCSHSYIVICFLWSFSQIVKPKGFPILTYKMKRLSLSNFQNIDPKESGKGLEIKIREQAALLLSITEDAQIHWTWRTTVFKRKNIPSVFVGDSVTFSIPSVLIFPSVLSDLENPALFL